MQVLSIEFKKMFSRRELYFLFMLSVLLAGISFCEWIEMYAYADVSIIPSAYRMTLVNGLSGVGRVVRFFLIPLFASFAYADCYYRESRNGTIALNITRMGRGKYYLSQATVSAIGGFLVVLFLFFINQLFCLLGFPAKEAEPFWTRSVYETSFFDDIERVAFPWLYMNAPLLNNLTFMLLAGVWGAASALMTYAISLYVRRNYLLSVSMATLINLIFTLIAIALPWQWGLEGILLPGYHLFADPSSSMSPMWVFVIKMAVWFGMPAGLIAFRMKNRNDILS